MPENEKMESYELAKASSLKGSYPVYKPNPLMLARDEMKIMQARFFSAYLCKVNPSDPSTYKARFSFSAFCNVLEVDKRNVGRIRAAADSVLECKFDFADYIRKHGKADLDPMLMKRVNLFEVFEITGNNDEGFFIEVTPTRPMEYLLQKQAELGYVSYQLQNVINLSTPRTIRLYEFLKRAEGRGISVDVPTLKAYLGLSANAYPEWRDFKRGVLDKGLKEINSDKTDIEASYTERRKGQGGKVVGFEFVVKSKKLKQKEEAPFDEETVELSQEDIDLFNANNQNELKEAHEPEKVKVTLLDGREAWVEKSLLYGPSTDLEYNNFYDLDTGIEEVTEPRELMENSEAESVYDEATEFERWLIDEIPEEVHGGEIDKVRAINDVVRKYVHTNFMDYLEFDEDEDDSTRMKKISEASRLAAEDLNDKILNAVRTYNIQDFNVRKKNIKSPSAFFAYYLAGLNGWLKNNRTLW